MSSRLFFRKYTSDPRRSIDAPDGIGTEKPVGSLYSVQPDGSDTVPPPAAGADDAAAEDTGGAAGAGVPAAVCCWAGVVPAVVGALLPVAAGTGAPFFLSSLVLSSPNAFGMTRIRSTSSTSTAVPAIAAWVGVSVVPSTVTPPRRGRDLTSIGVQAGRLGMLNPEGEAPAVPPLRASGTPTLAGSSTGGAEPGRAVAAGMTA